MSSLIQECNLCDKEIDHICEFNENPINRLTDEMKKFGIIGKIIQPKPKVDGEEKKIGNAEYPDESLAKITDIA